MNGPEAAATEVDWGKERQGGTTDIRNTTRYCRYSVIPHGRGPGFVSLVSGYEVWYLDLYP